MSIILFGQVRARTSLRSELVDGVDLNSETFAELLSDFAADRARRADDTAGGQNGVVGDIGLVTLGASEEDRTFLDQGEGIGVVNTGRTSAGNKGVDAGQALTVAVDDAAVVGESLALTLSLRSATGAITVEFVRDDGSVETQTLDIAALRAEQGLGEGRADAALFLEAAEGFRSVRLIADEAANFTLRNGAIETAPAVVEPEPAVATLTLDFSNPPGANPNTLTELLAGEVITTVTSVLGPAGGANVIPVDAFEFVDVSAIAPAVTIVPSSATGAALPIIVAPQNAIFSFSGIGVGPVSATPIPAGTAAAFTTAALIQPGETLRFDLTGEVDFATSFSLLVNFTGGPDSFVGSDTLSFRALDADGNVVASGTINAAPAPLPGQPASGLITPELNGAEFVTLELSGGSFQIQDVMFTVTALDGDFFG